MSARRIAIGIALVLTLTACSSSPASSTPPAATPTVVATVAPTPNPTPTPPSATTPGQTPGASITGDSVLAAMFPKLLAGQPVAVQTASLLDFMHAFGATEADIDTIRQSLAPIGIIIDTISFGVATATVTGSQIGWQALRMPGQDPNKLVQYYQLLELAPSNPGDTTKQETIGGKTVTVVRAADGSAVLWMYVNGEIFWSLATSDQNTAALVFASLP